MQQIDAFDANPRQYSQCLLCTKGDGCQYDEKQVKPLQQSDKLSRFLTSVQCIEPTQTGSTLFWASRIAG